MIKILLLMFVVMILLAGTIGIMTVNALPSHEDIQKDDTESKQADKDSGQEQEQEQEQVQAEEHTGKKMILPNDDEDKSKEQADECDIPDSKACKQSQEDNNDASDEEVAKRNAKDGGDLTVILKLKYSNLAGKYFKKVHLDIGKYFSKFYDLSSKPSQIKVKHLNVPEGKTFKVSLNNYATDEGESFNMRNSVCKCPESLKVRVP